MTTPESAGPPLASGRRSLTLEALPAEEGDCLLLTCRHGSTHHHVLIDGGTPGTAPRLRTRLAALASGRVELFIVTHIDADHIGGVVRLLRERSLPVAIGDVWFNGFRHLPRNAKALPRGVADAEELTAVLTGAKSGSNVPWNSAFEGAAVLRPAPKASDAVTGKLPRVTFPWGLSLTLLSPTPRRLDALYSGWNRYLAQLHAEQREPPVPRRERRAILDLDALAHTRSKEDNAAPNGSSIALLAEFAGRRILLGADAFSDVLYPALRSLAVGTEQRPPGEFASSTSRLHVDVLKLPHHGSQANVLSELFEVVRADHYLVSTNGNRFNHPDDEAMARVITLGGPGHTLWFNYRSDRTAPWDNPQWKRQYGYATRYPVSGAEGIAVVLEGR